MFKYIEEICKNVQLEEGEKTIENILITVYLKEGVSTKEIARRNLLPIPVVAAIKKELIKRDLVIQDCGTRLTDKGRHYIENQIGFNVRDKDLYMKLYLDPWKEHEEIMQIQSELDEIFDNRPRVDVTIDQSKSSIETSLKRAILCLKNHNLVGKKILCLGDDDLVSISLGFLLKKLLKGSNDYSTEITVVDIDKRFLRYINDIAIEKKLPIKCIYTDLRMPLPCDLKNQYDCVFTDPPYTIEGMDLFLSRGIESLKNKIGIDIYFSYAHKSSDFQLNMQRHFLRMGLSISQVMLQFNSYEGASIIGNTGQMIILKTTEKTKSLIDASYKGNLYTGEIKKTIRFYECKKCGEIIKVGNKEKFIHIEELKDHGCCKCGDNIFELTQKINVNA